MINTHHLHEHVESWAASRNHPIPVHIRHENEILGSGGGIKNAADFWDDRPFIVVNGDILTSIDFKAVYDYHLSHSHPATLVLCDDPEFNTVNVTAGGFVSGFKANHAHAGGAARVLTFTGVQALDPGVLDYIPDGVFSSSITAYESMIRNGGRIRAWIAGPRDRWTDLGTLNRYKAAAYRIMAEKAIQKVWPESTAEDILFEDIEGGGSDRIWRRIRCGGRSLFMADHGLRTSDAVTEADSFVSIGRLLYANGVPVPRIINADVQSGIVVMEDLGDVDFQSYVRELKTEPEIEIAYQTVIDHMIRMAFACREGFDPKAAYQTARYGREVILEKECRYFVDAFLNLCLNMDVTYERLEPDFHRLADRTMEFAVSGFMHRDFQSGNIMVKDGRFYFIDFQGGRIGPVQYDPASLLVDPYVGLNASLKQRLADYCCKRQAEVFNAEPRRFKKGYEYCSIARNLQILGAFGHLSRVKHKRRFEAYIPNALETLSTLAADNADEFPILYRTVVQAVSKGNIDIPDAGKQVH